MCSIIAKLPADGKEHHLIDHRPKENKNLQDDSLQGVLSATQVSSGGVDGVLDRFAGGETARFADQGRFAQTRFHVPSGHADAVFG